MVFPNINELLDSCRSSGSFPAAACALCALVQRGASKFYGRLRRSCKVMLALTSCLLLFEYCDFSIRWASAAQCSTWNWAMSTCRQCQMVPYIVDSGGLLLHFVPFSTSVVPIKYYSLRLNSPSSRSYIEWCPLPGVAAAEYRWRLLKLLCGSFSYVSFVYLSLMSCLWNSGSRLR